MTNSMRRWAGNVAASPRFAELQKQRGDLETKLRPIENDIRAAARKAPAPAVGATPAGGFDAKTTLGESWEDLNTDLGALPASIADLNKLASTGTAAIDNLKSWLADARQLKTVKDELNAPAQLDALMKSSGIPTGEQEIKNNQVQTRWLLCLALMVAFVGILNAMLMSVTERFREIGTMKCLGALDGFIVKLFLIESLFQGVVGTLSGLLIGVALSLLAVTNTYGRFAWIDVPWNELGIACLICLAVGVVLTVAGALYPAWQASRMQPIEAMRSDV